MLRKNVKLVASNLEQILFSFVVCREFLPAFSKVKIQIKC